MKELARFCGHPLCVLATLVFFGLLYMASDGVNDEGCSVCATDVCFDGLRRRTINGTCCACPPAPERWEFYEGDYDYYYPPVGLRTLRLSYDLQPGQMAVDEIYGTPTHPLRFPPAYHAFPFRGISNAYNDHRLGNVGGVSPAFNVINGDPAFGYPTYDSWLTLGDGRQLYLSNIDLVYETWSELVTWTDEVELLIDSGPLAGIRYMPGFNVSTVGQQSPVLVAQVSFNATERGSEGVATAWIGGPTTNGDRWSYAATWTWSF